MPFRRAPNCATGPLWWSARTPDPSTRIASTKRRALRVSRHLIPEPKQFARYDRHAGCAVQSLEASPSWQALQPAGLSGGDARATATRSAGGPPPLGSGRRRASSRSACPAFVPAEHANGYSRASRLFGTDARLSFLRNGERSFVWGLDRLRGNARLGPDTHQSVRSAGDFTRSSRPIKRRKARRPRPQPGLASIVGRSRQRNFFVIRLPTRFSRVIHRFSTDGLAADRKIRAGAPKVECG